MTSPRPRRHLASSPFARPVEAPPAVYEVGDRVSHDRYGLGRVVHVESTIAVGVHFGTETIRITLPTNKLIAI